MTYDFMTLRPFDPSYRENPGIHRFQNYCRRFGVFHGERSIYFWWKI